jgi:hypothetical protein
MINHAPVMAKVHNAVVDTLVRGVVPDHMGPSYGRAGSSSGTFPATSASDQMRAPATQSAAQPILTDTLLATLSPQATPVYSIAPPSVAPSAQNKTRRVESSYRVQYALHVQHIGNSADASSECPSRLVSSTTLPHASDGVRTISARSFSSAIF